MSCKLGMAVSFLHNIAPNFGSSVLHRFISNHQIIFCMNLNKVGKRKNAGAQLDFSNYHICIKD
jgi:hypothetical protein